MPYILTHFLTVADFPRQAITGKFTDQLLIKANGVDVAGAVMQPRELLFSWQGKVNEIAGQIPSEQISARIKMSTPRTAKAIGQDDQ